MNEKEVLQGRVDITKDMISTSERMMIREMPTNSDLTHLLHTIMTNQVVIMKILQNHIEQL